jgi:hypothetical protein
MALDRSQLKTAIAAVFNGSKAQGWDTDKVADELAKAIDDYVRQGEVEDVRVDAQLRQVGSVNLH